MPGGTLDSLNENYIFCFLVMAEQIEPPPNSRQVPMQNDQVRDLEELKTFVIPLLIGVLSCGSSCLDRVVDQNADPTCHFCAKRRRFL